MKIEDLRSQVKTKNVDIFQNEQLKKSPRHKKLLKAFKDSIQAMIDR